MDTQNHDNMENAGDLELTSGFMKYPSKRDTFPKNADVWLRGKRDDDGAYPYWRVHNKLYDLTDFIGKHPGGRFWLESTQGTDITELFESSHYSSRPEQILKKFFVKETHTQRNSPFTFKDDGFYRTLKRKAIPILNEVGTGPDKRMLFIQDSLLFGAVFFALFSAITDFALLAVVAGILLGLAVITSHNFFHQKDNWRMYVFDMSLFSSREWRISHAISHHVFPNTIYDVEISGLEPGLELLPKKNKSFFKRRGVIVTVNFVGTMSSFFSITARLKRILRRELKLNLENIIPLVQLVLIMILNGSILRGLWLWLVIHISTNSCFATIGLTAAHFHPDIYHEGDTAPSDKDWGIHQVVATRERGELFMKSLFLVSVTFGNHTLHHLFPTVDHSKLPHLLPALLETCAEFGIKFEPFTPWQLALGLFSQMARITTTKNPPTILK